MKKICFSLFIPIALVFFVFPIKTHAGILSPTYLLMNAVSSANDNSPNGMVTVTGMVSTTNDNVSPSLASLYFKTQENNNAFVTDQEAFSPDIDGSFTKQITGLACGSTQHIWLYEAPQSLIQYDDGSVTGQGFQIYIDCGQNVAPDVSGDILAPDSADAEFIAGVNWGTITVTDHSLLISGAHLIPLPPLGPKKYKIEYGYGSADQPNSTYQFIGESQVFTSIPPYNFSFQINLLTPNTNYYFNLWEVSTDGQGNTLSTNLFTYAYALTNQLTNNDNLQYTFPNSHSLHAYGNLTNNGGIALMNLPIKIVVLDAPSESANIVDSVEVVTSGPNLINGNGFFEYTFGNLTPGTTYYLVVRHGVTNVDLTQILSVTMPPENAINPTTPQSENPGYNGLVACDETTTPCDFNKLIETINRALDFLIVFVAFPLVAIIAAWAGFQLIVSGGSSEAKTNAKNMLGKVILGLVLALLSWAIIKLILVTLGYHGPLLCFFGAECPPN